MDSIALLLTALLFGGMTLYSFGFAAFVFSALPVETASPLLRRAFPHFYLFVLGVSGASGVFFAFKDWLSAAVMFGVFATTVLARQILMPAINAATDSGTKRRFKLLHTLSVLTTLGHIILAAWVLLRTI
ncbi:DUF4149 domain-containing protein [Roseobacter weihaiensis]|uniref:DUF4149 domain-containing protein n=1 Tax=Roseobacter weihaiensis TaxID=2763262 RepID=UPI003873A86C